MQIATDQVVAFVGTPLAVAQAVRLLLSDNAGEGNTRQAGAPQAWRGQAPTQTEGLEMPEVQLPQLRQAREVQGLPLGEARLRPSESGGSGPAASGHSSAVEEREPAGVEEREPIFVAHLSMA